MHYVQIIRVNPKSGAVERPWRQRDGSFVLGDPKHGAERHHDENAVKVKSYSEALELVRMGFAIRMSDGSSAPSLVVPASLDFVETPVDRLDDLWTYTMPEPPFTLDEVLADIRKHLVSQAADTFWIAGAYAASAFIGFDFEPWEHAEDPETRSRIDLEAFNLTRLARAAYVAAFRPYSSNALSEEDVDEIEQVLCSTMTQFSHRIPSPMDTPSSPLCRTLLAAYYRWQITDGCFLAGDRIDHAGTVAIEALTGMPQAAIRNALSRDGISVLKSKIDYPKLLEWLQSRRGFVPLREDEQPNSHFTWRVMNALGTVPAPEAFDRARKLIAHPPAELGQVETRLSAAHEAGRVPSEIDLRAYAQLIGALPDTFITVMAQQWAN